MIFKPLSQTKPLTLPFFAYSEVYWSYVIKKYFEPNTPRIYLAISETIEEEQDEISKIIKILCRESGFQLSSTLTSNICQIIRLYSHVVLQFIKNLDTLIQDLLKIKMSDHNNYIDILNRDYWLVGHVYYKENNHQKPEKLKEQIVLTPIDKNLTFNKISSDILQYSKLYNLILKNYSISYYNRI